jgi:hypothetical protein
VDYRQYRTFPNGYLIHLITGFIASALGAVAIPAVLENDFAAFTFLALAVEQFREVRRIENESLRAVDDMSFVPILKDVNRFIEIIKKAPLLETVKKSPKVLNTHFIEK